jgi:hypothetical protein
MRPIAEIASEICTLTGHINAANHRWLMLVAEYDRRAGWSDGDTQSCAHWLNWRCGIALGAAREKVRVARALENLPKISAAMASGGLSYSKVREITRIANADNESYLLQIAEHGTAAHVERLVRAYRRCQEAEELSREARQQQNRSVMFRYDDDGSVIIKCRLPAETGAQFLKAIELALEQLPVKQTDEFPEEASSDVPAGTCERIPFAARRADALALVAESFLAHGLLEMAGGDRHQIVVHVAEETLQEREAGGCEFENGPSMAAETARRLACDASIVEMVENEEGEPLNVGRKTRTISAPLRRLLKARDKGCRFPGCANSRYIDAHHIHHWANGGETKPSNLVSLCRFHHRSVHEGGIRIEMLDDGALRFVRRNGEAIESVAPGYSQPPGDWRQVPGGQMVNKWRGEKMDLGLAIDVLIQRNRQRKDVPAGTSLTLEH